MLISPLLYCSLVDCAVEGYQLESMKSVILRCPLLTDLELVPFIFCMNKICTGQYRRETYLYKKWKKQRKNKSCLLSQFFPQQPGHRGS